MEITESIDWLTSIPGVGRKTASCVLLFSFGMAAFPVDTHVLRVSKRLELVGDNISADKAHNLLEKLIQTEKYYQTHMDMIEHGMTVCISSKPKIVQKEVRTTRAANTNETGIWEHVYTYWEQHVGL